MTSPHAMECSNAQFEHTTSCPAKRSLLSGRPLCHWPAPREKTHWLADKLGAHFARLYQKEGAGRWHHRRRCQLLRCFDRKGGLEHAPDASLAYDVE